MSTKSGILSTILLTSLLIGLTNSCSTESTDPNTVTDPIKIDTGYISGTVIGDVDKEVRIYRGIPYAAPPLGDLRWKPPQPAAPWTGIRECTVFGKSSPQPAPAARDLADQSEDCLYLNVLTPAKKASDNLPVMVWLHGGGYIGGSGSSLRFNSARLPQHGVVLITINMRLGPFGLLAHPLLSKESPKGVSGNYIFFDMIAALEWVQRNINVFGGNPKNVTIFGVSGGGAKVYCLIASPMAKGLFHRGILESGVASGKLLPGISMKDLESIGEKFFAKLGVDKNADPLKAARALPTAKIMETDESLSKELEKDSLRAEYLWDSAIDQHFLTDAPADVLRAGKQNPVPVITSANLGELTGPGMIVAPYLVPEYVNMLNGVSKLGQKGYACIFDQVPGKWKKEGCVSFHSLEVAYVFGDVFEKPDSKLQTGNLLAMTAGAKSMDPGVTDVDMKVSENMMAMWAQFARTGNPNVKGLVNWPPMILRQINTSI